MEIELSYGGRPLADPHSFAELVEKQLPALATPMRSTVPLLACWRDPRRALEQLSAVLDEPIVGTHDDVVRAGFAYPVGVRRGRGKPSYTDLMIETDVHAIAIEAKYTEPAYDTVARWLSRARDAAARANRREVLLGWLELINRATGATLTIEAVGACTYQLIHRTAAAGFPEGRRWRGVVYLCFHDAERGAESSAYAAQMTRLESLIGPQPMLHFAVVDCAVRSMPRHVALKARWAAGERTLATDVRAGLLADDLVECGEWRQARR